MKLLVTGGAGYIGSHFCKAAAKAGHEVVVIDNLSTGHKEFVKWGPLVEGDLRDVDVVESTLREFRIEAVVHFAAKALVGESMAHPELYYSNNTAGMVSLLEALRRADVTTLLFSSSCATYRVATAETMNEQHPQKPINPYGRSKLQCEEMALDFHKLLGLRVGMLRYFNVMGQDPAGEVYEDHDPETHIIPNILKALNNNKTFYVFGDDYPTPDGTCVRDYVDVTDLALVHLAALEQLKINPLLISNVGVGRGYSVKEVFAAFESVFGQAPEIEVQKRRPGDPPLLVADATHFRSWYNKPMKTLEQSLATLKPRS